MQHHPTADVRGLKDERDACGVICGLCRHTIAKTGVSIKSESHIDLKQEGEGEEEGGGGLRGRMGKGGKGRGRREGKGEGWIEEGEERRERKI